MAIKAAETAAAYGSTAMVRKIEALYADLNCHRARRGAPERCLADR
jgi:hypothetical protein